MREPRAPLPPRDWGEAFAALSSETPPDGALERVFAQLPSPKHWRSRTSWWAAAAAVLALVAVVPLALNVARHSGASRDPTSRVPSPRSTTAVPPRKATLLAAFPTSDLGMPGKKTLGPGLRQDDGGKSSATDAPGPAQKHIAKADPPRRDKPHRVRESAPATDPLDKTMEPLYAESARLEALLAVARDDRVASATAVALGSDFEARVSAIDTALMQPSLSARGRLDLWRDRVSALRAYASFESTQRALAARGERYDAMLVSID